MNFYGSHIGTGRRLVNDELLLPNKNGTNVYYRKQKDEKKEEEGVLNE